MPKPKPMQGSSPNDFQTPPEALSPLYPYLKRDWIIWECAEGKGQLSQAFRNKGQLSQAFRNKEYKVVGSDILTGTDFLTWQPEHYDCIVTNPPFSLKQQFLTRAYSIGKPFAFLLPLTTLETRSRQQLFIKYGLEIILFDRRINFVTPNEVNNSKSWFATAWFTNGLNIGQQLTFISLVDHKQQGVLL